MRFLDFLMRLIITRHPLLDNLDHIYINLNTRNFEMLDENEYVFPVKFSLMRLDFEKLFLGEVLKVKESLLNDIVKTLSET